MKLRKRPVIIEANQYLTIADLPKGYHIGSGDRPCYKNKNDRFWTYPKIGDWVCTENGTDYFVLTDDYIKDHFEEVE